MRASRLLFLSIFAAMAQSAMAQTQIGLASRADPAVTGLLGSRRAAIVQGASVHQNETVQTSAAGRALLEFRDSTFLDIGPEATVKLDRFVFNPDSSARQAVISMTRGAFRFVTGASDPAAFRLQTPHATIGIRGTIVEFAIAGDRSEVSLRQGAATVCARSTGACVDLGPGDSVVVSAAGIAAAPGGVDPARGREPGGGESPGGGGGSSSTRG